MSHIVKSIVVPCYNEAQNIPSLIARFAALREGVSATALDWELVCVNNGSIDNSASVFEAECRKPGREFVRVVTVPTPNKGYGHGIMTGLRAAEGRFLAWTHADGQTPPADVLRAFELLVHATDPDRCFVKGRRRNRMLKDRLFTGGMGGAATLLLGTSLVDINAQPKAFTRALLDHAGNPPDDLSLDLYFFYKAKKLGFEVCTLDVDFGEREHGESKWAFNWRSKARHIGRALRYMNKLRQE